MAKSLEVLYDTDGSGNPINVAQFLSSSGITISRPATTAISSAKLHFTNREGIFSTKNIHQIITIRLDNELLFAGFVEKIYPKVAKKEGSILEVVAYDFGFIDLTDTYWGLVNNIRGFTIVPGETNVVTPTVFDPFLNGVPVFGDVGSIAATALGTRDVPRSDPRLNAGFIESKYTKYVDGDTGYNILKPILIRRESGLDLLKKICEIQAVSVSGLPIQHDFYLEPIDNGPGTFSPGATLKLFPRGSHDHTSTSSDPIVLTYKGPDNKSNNIIEGGISGDSIEIKNVIVGVFPAEQSVPLSGDEWTEGGTQIDNPSESHINIPVGTWTSFNGSGDPRATISFSQTWDNEVGVGQSHINFGTGSNPYARLTFINPLDIKSKSRRAYASTFIVFKWYELTHIANHVTVRLEDNNGNGIQQDWNTEFFNNRGWHETRLQLFTDAGLIASNWTNSGGGGVASFDATIIKKIEIQPKPFGGITPPNTDLLAVDGLRFEVYNFFSPVIVANQESFNYYDFRKSLYEITTPVSEEVATLLCVSELKARQTKIQGGTIVIKDNPLSGRVQTKVKPGDIISIDDGNRLTWVGNNSAIHTQIKGFRVSEITHTISKRDGFKTALNLQAWFGTSIASTSPDTNFLSWTRLYLPYGMGLQKIVDQRLSHAEAQINSGKKV